MWIRECEDGGGTLSHSALEFCGWCWGFKETGSMKVDRDDVGGVGMVGPSRKDSSSDTNLKGI